MKKYKLIIFALMSIMLLQMGCASSKKKKSSARNDRDDCSVCDKRAAEIKNKRK